MKLSEILASLPGIKLRAAKTQLIKWQNEVYEPIFSGCGEDPAQIDVGHGITLTHKEINNIFCSEDIPSVSPYGAQVLVQIYLAGLLPLVSKNTSPGEVPSQILSYAQSGETIADIQSRKCKEADAARKQYEELLSRPDDINPPFTFSLLNDLFARHVGLSQGSSSMVVGGFHVTKTVASHSSNSGKTRDWDVAFSWREKDGVLVEVKKESRFAGNRRNDSERNWGLPD